MPTRRAEVLRANNRRQREKLNQAARALSAAYIELHAERCPDCGARVLMPCRACGVESAKRAGAARESDNEPDDECGYLPTPDELREAMAVERAKHLAYKLAQPYRPIEERERSPKEVSPVEWDDEND